MANAAILVGNTDYRNLAKLECCRDDVRAIKQLLEATEKYEEITTVENAEADTLKSQLRAAIDIGCGRTRCARGRVAEVSRPGIAEAVRVACQVRKVQQPGLRRMQEARRHLTGYWQTSRSGHTAQQSARQGRRG